MRYLTKEGAAEVRTVRAGSALVCCIGATIGITDRTWKTSAFNQQINAIEWRKEIDDDFGVVCFLPIRLTQTPTTCRVYPIAGIKFGEGWGLDSARHSEQRTERVERVELSVEAECEFVEVGL